MGWTATRNALWEICTCFADWLHSCVDLGEVNIRIWKFLKDESQLVILEENSTVHLYLCDSFYGVAFTDPSILF